MISGSSFSGTIKTRLTPNKNLAPSPCKFLKNYLKKARNNSAYLKLPTSWATTIFQNSSRSSMKAWRNAYSKSANKSSCRTGKRLICWLFRRSPLSTSSKKPTKKTETLKLRTRASQTRLCFHFQQSTCTSTSWWTSTRYQKRWLTWSRQSSFAIPSACFRWRTCRMFLKSPTSNSRFPSTPSTSANLSKMSWVYSNFRPPQRT